MLFQSNMKTEITNMRFALNTCLQRIEYAALQDDERITEEEEKKIKRIKKAMSRFTKELNKLEY